MSIYNKGFKWHFHQVLIAIDQLINTLLGGWADCTLSARLYRNGGKYWYARLGMKLLDFIARPCGKEHCHNAYLSEVERKHLWDDASNDKINKQINK